MRVGSCVFLVNFLQILVAKNVVIGILSRLLLTSVQPQWLFFFNCFLLVGSADWSVALFDPLLLPLQYLVLLP